jgi:predicted transcriptional regulator
VVLLDPAPPVAHVTVAPSVSAVNATALAEKATVQLLPGVQVVPLIVVVGTSALTSARKVGAAAAPELGPANTVFAVCVFGVSVSVPLEVTGEPLTAYNGPETLSPTLVTDPAVRAAHPVALPLASTPVGA